MDLINSNSISNRVYTPLLHDYRLLLSQLQQVRVAHVFREANKCADFLAKRGCYLQADFDVYDQPPSIDLLPLLYTDVYGVSFCRLISPTLVTVPS